jgi:hypothetical protein
MRICDHTLHETLATRLLMLKDEQKKGQDELMQLETRAAYLRQQLLRIDGAIAVLEELLKEHSDA